jgi:DNA replication protein DnaC
MNTESTLQQLRELKLPGMEQRYRIACGLPVHQQPGAHEMIALLAEAEVLQRQTAKTQMLLQRARIRFHALPEQIHVSPTRAGLTKEQLLQLCDCSFIEKSENILITGATGCGKSYIACAIGRQACSLGYRTLYFGMNRFIEALATARLDGTYIKWLNQVAKAHLIILDDFGLQPLDNNIKLTILQILEDRYAKASTIITSQLPVKNWFEYMKEPTLADAIMDRLTASAHRIELEGKSLRKKEK